MEKGNSKVYTSHFEKKSPYKDLISTAGLFKKQSSKFNAKEFLE